MTIKEMRLAAGFTQSEILEGYEDPRLKRPDVSRIEEGIVDAPKRFYEHVRDKCKDYIKEDVKTPDTACAQGEISIECRNLSYALMDAATRRAKIYRLFTEHGAMTAREVRDKIGAQDMNYVRPRITELAQKGMLAEAGKKKDAITDRQVTVWRAI